MISMSAVGNRCRDASAIGAQFGIDGPGIIAPGLPKGLSNPFCDGHVLSAGNALNLSVLFLIEENLKSL